MLSKIRENIEKHGHHVYSVQGGESPRYLYTIGLTDQVKAELVLPGMAQLPTSEALRVLNLVALRLREGVSAGELELEIDSIGRFGLSAMHPSWSPLLLGALDHYGFDSVRAWQVRPVNQDDFTIDVPDMTRPFEPSTHPVWKWMEGGWPYSVPSKTIVVTNKDALSGYAVSELTRWENDEFEMFSGAGPEVAKEDIVLAPLATLLAFDPTLAAALSVKPGEGLYREFDDDGQAGPWQAWRRKPLAQD